MTVCIGALGNYSTRRPKASAIVCVADKATTLGEDIQWESDTDKIVELGPSGPVLLTSGDDRNISRLVKGLKKQLKVQNVDEIVRTCEDVYGRCFAELTTRQHLSQILMSPKEFVAAVSGTAINPFVEGVARKMAKYNMDCDVVLCGFDSSGRPFLVQAESPGVATDVTSQGFEVIGSGSDRAAPRLLWSGYERAHSVDRLLYDVFDAKANAEMNVGVGYEWDATIVVAGRIVRVPTEIKQLVERAWIQYSYSPFEQREPDDLPKPPRNWKEQLKKYITSVLKPTRGRARARRRTRRG